jgi:hypothetical protein
MGLEMVPHQSIDTYQTNVFISFSSHNLEKTKTLEQDLANQANAKKHKLSHYVWQA